MGIEVKVSAEARRVNEQARDNATRTTTSPRVYGVSSEQRLLKLYLKQAFSDYYSKRGSGKKAELFLRGFKQKLKEDLSTDSNKAPPAIVYAVDRNKIPMPMDLQDVVANWDLKSEAFSNHLAPESGRLSLHKETVQKDYGHLWN